MNEMERIAGMLNFNSAGNFANYLMDTLIPDLKASGSTEMAKDFAKAAHLIMTGTHDSGFIGFISRRLVPDLRESGYDATADDLLEAAYWISRGGMKAAAVAGTRLSLVRKPDTDEWVVKVYVNGKYDEGKSYYTDDKQDAINTMSRMKKDMGITAGEANMNREAVAKELISIAKELMATTGTFKCPNCGTKVLKNTGYCVKCEKKVKEAAWESLPGGWTKASLKSFYDSLAGGGNAKAKFYSCVDKIGGTNITNPESFCGSLMDQFMDPSWRGVGR